MSNSIGNRKTVHRICVFSFTVWTVLVFLTEMAFGQSKLAALGTCGSVQKLGHMGGPICLESGLSGMNTKWYEETKHKSIFF